MVERKSIESKENIRCSGRPLHRPGHDKHSSLAGVYQFTNQIRPDTKCIHLRLCSCFNSLLGRAQFVSSSYLSLKVMLVFD
jgi:hypothetical protein